jgi:hypothetical protein
MTIEKSIRKFVRKQFAARIVKVDGVGQCVAKKNSARVLIRNPKHVLVTMQEKLGRAVEQHDNVTVFKVAKVGKIALTSNGLNSVLTLVNA